MRFQFPISLLVILTLGTALPADDELTITPLGIRSAENAFRLTKEKSVAEFEAKDKPLRDERDSKTAAARSTYLQAVDNALKNAMRSTDLPLTNQINALRQTLTARSDLDSSGEDPSRVYLTSLEHFNVIVHDELFGKSGALRALAKVTVDGKYSPHGIVMVPPSQAHASVQFHLDGKFARFKGAVALNDSCNGNDKGRLTFEALGDGKSLWTSAPIAKWKTAYDCAFSVRGVKVLDLRVNCPGGNADQVAAWIEPQVLRQGEDMSLPPPIRDADQTYQRARAKAAADYEAKAGLIRKEHAAQIARARQVYLQSIDAAVKDALRSNDVTTANQLNRMKTSVAASTEGEAAPTTASLTYLCTLEHFEPVAMFGKFGKSGVFDDKIKIAVDGKYSPNGMMLHPPDRGFAKVQFHLDGKYARFISGVALNDSCEGNDQGHIAFEVLGDGKSLWRGDPIASWKTVYECEVDVQGVKTLELRVHCPGGCWYQHAVWIEPRLMR